MWSAGGRRAYVTRGNRDPPLHTATRCDGYRSRDSCRPGEDGHSPGVSSMKNGGEGGGEGNVKWNLRESNLDE